jgi:hypothetical protein
MCTPSSSRCRATARAEVGWERAGAEHRARCSLARIWRAGQSSRHENRSRNTRSALQSSAFQESPGFQGNAGGGQGGQEGGDTAGLVHDELR